MIKTSKTEVLQTPSATEVNLAQGVVTGFEFLKFFQLMKFFESLKFLNIKIIEKILSFFYLIFLIFLSF